MTQTHHVTFAPDAVPLSCSPSNALISERSRKKDFPSVAKLLDGLSFQDESHPDFLLRASSRPKPRTSNPLLHRSSPSIAHPALYRRSSSANKSTALLSPSPHPLARLNTLEPTDSLTSSQSISPSSIPLLIQRSSDPTRTTTSSFSPTSSSSETRTVSLKRPYTISSASSDDSDDDESESDQSNTAENCPSDCERAARSSSAFSLGIVWQTEMGQSGRADCDPRPIVHPSLSWLSKHAVDRSTITPTTTTAAAAVNGVGRCLGNQKTAGNHLFAELLASQSLHIRQVDKRRLTQ
ncbi:uncharacterized protein VP01_3713g2 [Puccinia sorghi]|uniref:Uncharacterized protein n=1 Tax=Puccinia sorghi TaxID=27349 RepID=A0A0L6UW00_9BASI|nr:uncharacterized protein VP01_3713g2 [Puccinia sorghi]